jgi:hypothetical protein
MGIDAVLAGSASADPPVWAAAGRSTIEILWPPGFIAVFDPDLRIVSPEGELVARAGDALSGRFLDRGLFVCSGPTRFIILRMPT